MFRYQLSKRLNINKDIKITKEIYEENISFMRDIDRQWKMIHKHIVPTWVDDKKEPFYGSPDSMDELLILEEEYEELYASIKKLSKVQQTRIQLRFFENLTYVEIAKREHCTAPAARKSVLRALKRLHELMSQK